MRTGIMVGVAALLAAATFVVAQGRGDKPTPYRAVVTVGLRVGTRKAKDKFFEIPDLTEALNQLAADGYEVDSITPWPDGRVLLVGKSR